MYLIVCLNFKVLIHVTCKSNGGNPANELKKYVEKLFKNYSWVIDSSVTISDNEISGNCESVSQHPQVIWSMYFNIPMCQKCLHSNVSPYKGLYLSCGPFYELDYDLSIKEVISFVNLYNFLILLNFH